MTSRIARSIALALAATLVAGCTTDPVTGQPQLSRTVIGAGLGAAAGAGIGALVGDKNKEKRRNALIGAGIGTLAGGAVGVYMDRQEAKLRAQLQGTGVSITRVGDNLVLNMPGSVTFATDSPDVRAQFYPVLNSVALVLKEFDRTFVHVTGHTDSTGQDSYNQLLSERRADSVAGYLGSQGVYRERILTRGFGSQMPVASNQTPEGRQANRRVEITLEPIRA